MEVNKCTAKVIVLGQSGVGKTSILLRLEEDKFNQNSQSTSGVHFISKLYSYDSTKTVQFQIWDTAGQEKYKSIASLYYKDSQIALCVFDITSQQSFMAMKSWVNQVKAKGPPNIILSIVGNKIDLSDNEAVSYSEAKQYAESEGAYFKFTSAKDGKGINELFMSFASKIYFKERSLIAAERQSIELKPNQTKLKQSCCWGGKSF